MIGLKGLQDDLNIAHSVHASKLQSDVSFLFPLTYQLRHAERYSIKRSLFFPFGLAPD